MWTFLKRLVNTREHRTLVLSVFSSRLSDVFQLPKSTTHVNRDTWFVEKWLPCADTVASHGQKIGHKYQDRILWTSVHTYRHVTSGVQLVFRLPYFSFCIRVNDHWTMHACPTDFLLCREALRVWVMKGSMSGKNFLRIVGGSGLRGTGCCWCIIDDLLPIWWVGWKLLKSG